MDDGICNIWKSSLWGQLLKFDNLVDFAVGNEITIAAIPWRTDVAVLHQNQRLRQRMAEEADLRGG